MGFVELMRRSSDKVDPPRVGWTMSIRGQWCGETSDDMK
jgi:hypothetical protein